jgi:hypothetical protein
MSKKHFIQVAAVLRTFLETGRKVDVSSLDHPVKAGNFNRGAEYAANVIAHNLAFIFAEENPRFDRARFLEACNVNQEA